MTDPYTGPACEVPGCTRPQAVGWRVCASDGRWLGDTLARLADRYNRLSAAPSIRSASASDGSGKGGTLASQRDPARLHVLVLTDPRSKARDPAEPTPDDNDGLSVFEVLHAHAEAVREARALAYPTRVLPGLLAGDRPAGPACDTCGHDTCRWIRRAPDVTAPALLTVATERAVLAAHLDWVLGQDWAAEFHADLTALWTLLGGSRPVGVCPDCGGGLHTRSGGVACAGCGRSWSGLAIAELSTTRRSA